MNVRFWRSAALAVLTGALAASPAPATTFAEVEFTCPVGGEEFTAMVPASRTSWGQRPDGRAYGTLPVWPLPECPENGLVLFDDDFTEAELAMLGEAVGSREYQALRASQTQHYRAWWLKARIGRSLVSQADSLLQASWESDEEPARKARYQAAFADMAGRIERSADNAEDWFWLNLRAANALRELGRFQDGLERLALVMRREHLPEDAATRQRVEDYARALEQLMGEANSHSEPANLVPSEVAMFRCVLAEPRLTASESEACASPAIRERIAQARHEDEDGNRLEGEAAVRAMAERGSRPPAFRPAPGPVRLPIGG